MAADEVHTTLVQLLKTIGPELERNEMGPEMSQGVSLRGEIPWIPRKHSQLRPSLSYCAEGAGSIGQLLTLQAAPLGSDYGS